MKRENGKGDPTLVPCVLETRVFPMFLFAKTDGALMSYQSFLEKGSTLYKTKKQSNQIEISLHMQLNNEQKREKG